MKSIDGDDIKVDLTATIFSGSEKTWNRVLITINDITERDKMEKVLLRSQKLEALGILAGGIAHDFNNILTTIIGNISMAKTQVSQEDEIFDLLNESEAASTRAKTLTNQLLTFAKGGTPVKETSLIKDIIMETSLFVLRGSKSGCEFSIKEDLWPVDVDVGQISQVINNIVTNANQAMPEGGIIQVAAENHIIEDRHDQTVKQGRYVRISIKDQGVGKECVVQLKKINPEVKAIVSSGYSDDPVLANFQEYGFKGILPKPFDLNSLSKVIDDVIQV